MVGSAQLFIRIDFILSLSCTAAVLFHESTQEQLFGPSSAIKFLIAAVRKKLCKFLVAAVYVL